MHTVTVRNRFCFGCRSIGDSSNKENFAEQMSIYFSLFGESTSISCCEFGSTSEKWEDDCSLICCVCPSDTLCIPASNDNSVNCKKGIVNLQLKGRQIISKQLIKEDNLDRRNLAQYVIQPRILLERVMKLQVQQGRGYFGLLTDPQLFKNYSFNGVCCK